MPNIRKIIEKKMLPDRSQGIYFFKLISGIKLAGRNFGLEVIKQKLLIGRIELKPWW
jgi:hypothetical protein